MAEYSTIFDPKTLNWNTYLSEFMHALKQDVEAERLRLASLKKEKNNDGRPVDALFKALNRAYQCLGLKRTKTVKIDSSKLRKVVGPFGCGKSHWIRRNFKEDCDFVITTTSRLKEEFKAELNDSNMVDTPHRAMARLCSGEFRNIYLDEAFMHTPGIIAALFCLCNFRNLYLVGDPKQINFIDRNRQYVNSPIMRKIADSVPGVLLTANYRNGYDVVELARQRWGYDMHCMRIDRTPTIFYKRVKYVDRLPLPAIMPYMTFTQDAKNLLCERNVKNNLKGGNAYVVNSVHENQGATYDKVALLITEDSRSLLKSSEAHQIVAFTRHRKELYIYDETGLGRNYINIDHPASKIIDDHYGMHEDNYAQAGPQLALEEPEDHRPVPPPTM